MLMGSAAYFQEKFNLLYLKSIWLQNPTKLHLTILEISCGIGRNYIGHIQILQTTKPKNRTETSPKCFQVHRWI